MSSATYYTGSPTLVVLPSNVSAAPTQQPPAHLTYLNFAENIATLLLQLVAVPLAVNLISNSILHPSRLTVSSGSGSGHGGLSKSMVAFIVTHAIASTAMLPYGVYTILGWSPPTTQPRTVPMYDPPLLFWLGMPTDVYIVVTPVAVFFLTLDRLLTLTYGPSYGRAGKSIVLYVEVVALLGVAFGLVALKVVLEFPPPWNQGNG